MPHVLTLTLNPAVDVSTQVERVTPVHKLRCGVDVWHPGGGGINVARVAQRLGSTALAIYPQGGVIGEALHNLLQAEHLPLHAIPIGAQTRQNFSVHESSSGEDFRFVLPGPELSAAEWTACRTAFMDHLSGSTHAVISGSLPPGLSEHCYAQLCREAQAQGRRVILDASGPALRLALQAGVELVKPSLRELAELVGHPLRNEADWRAAAASLVEQHQATIVALSLGEQGALVVTRQHHWRARALPVTVRSTIGAGDSFLGGWLHGWKRQGSNRDTDTAALQEAFRWAMATAASAVSSFGTALCDAAHVQSLLPQVVIETL